MIKVILKPEKGIQIDETKKYLFDPSVVQPYVDASAENATKAEESANRAEQTFANASAFVDASKSEITGIIEQGKTEIATAIDDGRMEISDSILEATEEVKKAGAEAAQEAVQGAADEATRIATEQTNIYVVNTIEPKLQEYASNAEADASNASESAGHASESASDASHYAEDARIWAEGEQAEVKPLGGELSSMGAADLAYALANAPEDTPIDTANMFAMNIFKGEKGDKGDKGDAGKDGKIGIESFATNCITEIPQDIKLELNSGVISAKAGSKIRYPNGKNADGSLRFGEIVLESDITSSFISNADRDVLVYLNMNNNTLGYNTNVTETHSGTSAPSGAIQYHVWYDTANNIVKMTVDKGVTWTTGYSLPIALVKMNSSSVVTSIDQVFNGFGYIGSTAFALPGVKGLIPNGRNADGSLKNVEFTVDKVLTVTGSYPSDYKIMLKSNSIGAFLNLYYDDANNINVDSDNPKVNSCIAGTMTRGSGGVITSFTPKLPFRAVDYSDSSWVSAQAMPSGKYINLTLGASGTKYTAPANGWFYFRGKASAANSYVALYYIDSSLLAGKGLGEGTAGLANISIPVVKGQQVSATYANINTSGDTFIRFIYAEGEE
jgi:hypothetical protein